MLRLGTIWVFQIIEVFRLYLIDKCDFPLFYTQVYSLLCIEIGVIDVKVAYLNSFTGSCVCPNYNRLACDRWWDKVHIMIMLVLYVWSSLKLVYSVPYMLESQKFVLGPLISCILAWPQYSLSFWAWICVVLMALLISTNPDMTWRWWFSSSLKILINNMMLKRILI